MLFALPPDIINAIYEYDGTKREQLEKCLAAIETKGALSRLNSVSKIWCERNYREYDLLGFHSFLVKFVNDEDVLIGALFKCTCCKRHAQDKPSCKTCPHYAEYLQTISFPNDEDRDACKCACRHYSRHLYEL